MNYTKQEILDLQRVSLQMAENLIDVCNRNHLTLFVCGGGLIGAARNGGFIPWDDDLDFLLPRQDFEKLSLIWAEQNKNKHMRLFLSSPSFSDRNMFMTIRDDRTTQIKPYQKDLDICHGVSMDIFPLDGCPKSKVKQKIQLVYAMIHALYRTEIVPTKHGKMIEMGGNLLLSLVKSHKMRAKIWMYAEKKMSKYSYEKSNLIKELCSAGPYWNYVYQKSWFCEQVWLPFENTFLPAPKGYHAYLSASHGDYMTLPPVEKRVAHHDALLLDVNKSYSMYQDKYGKGIKK